MVSTKDKILQKYFDRRGRGEINAHDFAVRLLGYISFTVAILAILMFLYYRLFI
ncbi:MAG: hypothetical protein PHV51_05960 [Methanosarcinaceae archaeon]|nr:hypothetical protein [Methanosarcinaceae archaeon]MDD4497679.1 hypothetical protein [Methanosarcinaceae archaeon]